MIEVDGKRMCVKRVGEGNEVIVISPGFGSISPVLEMKALVNGLKDQYPDEVSGDVSIDGAVPKQNLEEEGSILQYQLLSLMNKTGIYRFLAEHDEEGIVPSIKGGELTAEETKQYKALAYSKFMNDGIIDEFKQSKENFSKVELLKFPATCPVLTFLSSENCEATPNWQELHDELVTMKTQDQDVILEGSHYLQYEYGQEMAKQFNEWRQKNSL